MGCMGFSIAVISLVVEHSPDMWASIAVAMGLLSHRMWDLPRPGINLFPLHWQVDF